MTSADDRPRPDDGQPQWIGLHRGWWYLVMVAATLAGVGIAFARDPMEITPIVVVLVALGVAVVVILGIASWRRQMRLFPELRGARQTDDRR